LICSFMESPSFNRIVKSFELVRPCPPLELLRQLLPYLSRVLRDDCVCTLDAPCCCSSVDSPQLCSSNRSGHFLYHSALCALRVDSMPSLSFKHSSLMSIGMCLSVWNLRRSSATHCYFVDLSWHCKCSDVNVHYYLAVDADVPVSAWR
jgi:hypothetical protein